jgi:aminobenzoyl-glutamate utilization protein B
MKYEVVSGSFNLVPNETLARLMYNNLKTVGGVKYTAADVTFAKEIQSTLSGKVPALETAQAIEEFKTGGFFPASTDVGDITWVVPTAGLGTATWVPGVPAHSWQAVATGSKSIGLKGMINAAKVIAMTGVDIFNNPVLADKARKELTERVGADFHYKALLGDRAPALDFRKGKQ